MHYGEKSRLHIFAKLSARAEGRGSFPRYGSREDGSRNYLSLIDVAGESPIRRNQLLLDPATWRGSNTVR